MRSTLTAASTVSLFSACVLLTTLSSPAHGLATGANDEPEVTTTQTSEDDSLSAFEQLWRSARPMIAIQYGFGDLELDGFSRELASVGAIGVEIGFRAEEDFAGEAALVHQSTNFAHVGHIASRLASDTPGPTEVGTDMWRFGLGFGDGYGYRFSNDRTRLVLQSSGALGWYTTDLEGEAVSGLPSADAALLDQFTSHTRYGDSWESAVEFGVGDLLSLHAGYERAAVFPSFKVWYWLLSSMIDRGALVAADLFVDKVAEASPYAAPVVRFVLEGALQYAFYELRKDDMNWPFETEAPIVVDQFKLGVTTRF